MPSKASWSNWRDIRYHPLRQTEKSAHPGNSLTSWASTLTSCRLNRPSRMLFQEIDQKKIVKCLRRAWTPFLTLICKRHYKTRRHSMRCTLHLRTGQSSYMLLQGAESSPYVCMVASLPLTCEYISLWILPTLMLFA